MLFSRASLLAAAFVLAGATVVSFVGWYWTIFAPALLMNGLIVVAWLAACGGIGSLVLRPMRLNCGNALTFVLAESVGLGIVSILVLLLGLSGALNHIIAILLLAFGFLAAAWKLYELRKNEFWNLTTAAGKKHWLWLALMPLLGLSLLCAMIPPGLLWGDEPNGYDVTEYHLQVPREWFEAGRIVPLTHNVFSYFPFNVEMHYLLAMRLWGGPWEGMYVAQLMHPAFIALTVVAIYALLVERHPRGAVGAAVIAGATPWLPLLGPVAYNEGGLLFFGTLAIGLCLHSLREDRPAKWIVLAGLFAGFACGSKLTAGPMVLLPMMIILAVVFKSVRLPAIFVACCAITLSPWLIRNIAWTHNPVFPEMTSIFGKAHWSDTQVERYQRANHLPRAEQQSLSGRLEAGWDQVLNDWRFGYIVIPLGIIAAFLRRDRETKCLIALLLMQAVFWLFLTHLQSRFFVLSIPICALLIGGVAQLRWFAILAAFGGTLFIGAKLNSFHDQVGMKGLELYSALGMPHAIGLPEVPEKDDGKIVELVGDGNAFCCDVPMSRLFYRTVFDVDVKPGESVIDAWSAGWPHDADAHVVVNLNELARFYRTYWGIPAPPNQ